MALNKKEVQNIIATYLLDEPYTQLASIKNTVENELKRRGEIGPKSKGNAYYSHHWVERISDGDALLINEVIYDFLYDRIITPGINKDNLELPWIHVSNKEKLKEYL